MTTVRAEYDPSYFKRFLWLAVGTLLFGSWFLFDGLVTYPNELKRCEAYWVEEEEQKEGRRKKYRAIEEAKWEQLAKDNDWSTKPPKTTPDEQRQKTIGQYFYAALSLIIAIVCLVKWFLPRGSWIEGSEEELTTSWGTRFRYDEIKQINKKKWVERGIAKITFTREGRSGGMVFDDYKYLREPMSQIMVAMEAGLSDDQIVGAEREADRLARQKREADEREAAEPDAAQTDEPASDE